MTSMSMRQRVGRQEIEQFLIQVGRTQQPGRLYFTGGAALVHRGIRLGQTLDIYIQITIDPANLTTQIAQLKQKMNIDIEFASPGDFIPLPTQWEARSEFIKRYNQVDVQLLIRVGVVEVTELDRLCQDVLSKIGRPPYDRFLPNLSSQQFAQPYQAVRQLL